MRYFYPINMDQEEIQANARGDLSKAQIRILHQRRLLFLAATFGFGGIWISLFILLYLKLRDPSFLSSGELFFWIPIGLFWMWLLRRSPVQLANINIDLREGKVAEVAGRVIGRWRNTFGLIQHTRYEIQVAGEVFALSGSEFFQFTNQGDYRVVYSPRAKVFLGAVPITTPLDSDVAHAIQIDAVEDILGLLTPRELEILQRLADGLSNQEIADQLFLSLNTIKMYTSQIYRKMGVRRRTEAVALARQWKIL